MQSSILKVIFTGIAVSILSATKIAFAQSPCAVLIVGQSLAKGVYDQREGLSEIFDKDSFKGHIGCSSIAFVNGATGGSAAECAITHQQEDQDPSRPMNCWINRNPAYNRGQIGNALKTALNAINGSMNNPQTDLRKKIVAIIWSQGEKDSGSIDKTLTHLILPSGARCAPSTTYCKAVYKHNVNEIFKTLRGKIAEFSSQNFGLTLSATEPPVFIPVIGRRAFPTSPPSSMLSLDKGIQQIREVQYELAGQGANIHIAALGYDQPLGALPSEGSQVHPTVTGYLETAKRLGYSIHNYFYNTLLYLGPKIIEASWEQYEDANKVMRDGIAVKVQHSAKTSMLGTLTCGTDTPYCGFKIYDGVPDKSFKFSVIKGPVTTVSGMKHTTYWIRDLFRIIDEGGIAREVNIDPNKQIGLAFAYGSMGEVNFRAITNGVETNTAKYILMQKCLSNATEGECDLHENHTLPIQPAFYLSTNKVFLNKLNK